MTYKERVLMECKEQYRIKDEALRTSGEESSQLNTELIEELRLQVQRYQRLTKTVSEKGDEIDRLKMRLSEKEEELKRKKNNGQKLFSLFLAVFGLSCLTSDACRNIHKCLPTGHKGI
ncbi:uncharacterized protein LOC128222048 isoform X2 [Mya arenaria]|uniref:uncharacterized protein LOC128222048 isoform X2 n=1 Tax=Mya arenaria TaxID=6604 RepID=UPI0022DF44D4|nr:uncharacterized protein LOC128222048 isoform X2 [Mya arenaria]